jgi:hypothetical protein
MVRKVLLAVLAIGLVFCAACGIAQAQTGDFSLQVTPSPLVTSVKPGTKTELELKIRNSGTKAEDLKIEPRSFTIDNSNEEVKLNDTTPPDIADWISFSAPKFKVQPGEWFTQKVIFTLPNNTGFSYSFALIISRQSEPKATEAGRLIKGSVAVFTLVNVDRPGATRKLEVGQFKVSQHVYEYLPAELSVEFKNGGNTIVQPYGNIFIQRGSDDKSPISTLPVNDKKGYILPGSVRTMESDWSGGFPAYKTKPGGEKELVWDWSKVADFRVGPYTAKLVAVYNDGKRDVPIEGEVTFWVFPWKILGGMLLVTILAGFGLWSLIRKIISLFRRGRGSKRF